MFLLALDLGTTLGWAVFGPQGFVESGSMCLKHKTTEKITDVERRLRLYSFLDRKSRQYNTSNIAVEQVNAATMRGNRQRELHYGDRAVLELVCAQRAIPLHYAPVGSVKKHATGNGAAKKDQMISAMITRGYHVTDDNEADALSVALFILAQIQRKAHATENEQGPAVKRQRRAPNIGDGGAARPRCGKGRVRPSAADGDGSARSALRSRRKQV